MLFLIKNFKSTNAIIVYIVITKNEIEKRRVFCFSVTFNSR
jgi:hypothetical protein